MALGVGGAAGVADIFGLDTVFGFGIVLVTASAGVGIQIIAGVVLINTGALRLLGTSRVTLIRYRRLAGFFCGIVGVAAVTSLTIVGGVAFVVGVGLLTF